MMHVLHFLEGLGLSRMPAIHFLIFIPSFNMVESVMKSLPVS
jgi:hypothetical protein